MPLTKVFSLLLDSTITYFPSPHCEESAAEQKTITFLILAIFHLMCSLYSCINNAFLTQVPSVSSWSCFSGFFLVEKKDPINTFYKHINPTANLGRKITMKDVLIYSLLICLKMAYG